MKIKTMFTLTCIASSMLASGYFAYNYGKNSHSDDNTKDFETRLAEYKTRLAEKDNLLDKIQSNMPKPETLIKAMAEEKWGREEVEALALNGLNECPSNKFQSEATRCSEYEEAAMMYAVLNQYKQKVGKSLKEIIYSKVGNNAMFSWTTGGRQTGYTNSKGFEHSRLIASYVLSGHGKYYNVSQFEETHYCNDNYIQNGSIKSGCLKWHKPHLEALGRIVLVNPEVPRSRILDSELSKHSFFKVRGK
jgi:hypothetical protein